MSHNSSDEDDVHKIFDETNKILTSDNGRSQHENRTLYVDMDQNSLGSPEDVESENEPITDHISSEKEQLHKAESNEAFTSPPRNSTFVEHSPHGCDISDLDLSLLNETPLAHNLSSATNSSSVRNITSPAQNLSTLLNDISALQDTSQNLSDGPNDITIVDDNGSTEKYTPSRQKFEDIWNNHSHDETSQSRLNILNQGDQEFIPRSSSRRSSSSSVSPHIDTVGSLDDIFLQHSSSPLARSDVASSLSLNDEPSNTKLKAFSKNKDADDKLGNACGVDAGTSASECLKTDENAADHPDNNGGSPILNSAKPSSPGIPTSNKKNLVNDDDILHPMSATKEKLKDLSIVIENNQMQESMVSSPYPIKRHDISDITQFTGYSEIPLQDSTLLSQPSTMSNAEIESDHLDVKAASTPYSKPNVGPLTRLKSNVSQFIQRISSVKTGGSFNEWVEKDDTRVAINEAINETDDTSTARHNDLVSVDSNLNQDEATIGHSRGVHRGVAIQSKDARLRGNRIRERPVPESSNSDANLERTPLQRNKSVLKRFQSNLGDFFQSISGHAKPSSFNRWRERVLSSKEIGVADDTNTAGNNDFDSVEVKSQHSRSPSPSPRYLALPSRLDLIRENSLLKDRELSEKQLESESSQKISKWKKLLLLLCLLLLIFVIAYNITSHKRRHGSKSTSLINKDTPTSTPTTKSTRNEIDEIGVSLSFFKPTPVPQPTRVPSLILSMLPSTQTLVQVSTSMLPSAQPTGKGLTSKPTWVLSSVPSFTIIPSHSPTFIASSSPPSRSSSLRPSPELQQRTVTFYALGGIPFTRDELFLLEDQISSIPDDAEFVVHVGDIMDAGRSSCEPSQYEDVRSILAQSKAPVFILPGHNDWSECANSTDAWISWSSNFRTFESDNNWDVSHFGVERLSIPSSNKASANFSFLRKGVLFVGVHIVGGTVHNETEWSERHALNLKFVLNKVKRHSMQARSLVLLGQARPKRKHRDFFIPLRRKLENYYYGLGFDNFIYIHGDGNVWDEYYFRDLRCVQLDQGAFAPPLNVSLVLDGSKHSILLDRRLEDAGI